MQIMMNIKRLDETFSTIFLVTESLMIIPTIFGNLLLIICIKRYNILQIWSNILIANLAVSDFLLGLIFIPYDMTLKHVRVMSENKFACLLRNALLLQFVGASVFNLLLLSLERYAALAFPLWHFKLSSKWLICSIAVSWIMSTVIAGLPLAGWNIVNSTNLECTNRFNDNLPISYQTFFISVFLTSIVISFILFIKVVIISFKVLKSYKDKMADILRISPRQLKSSIEKTKLLILVLGVFVLCWLPYGVIVVLELFIPRENKTIIQAKAYSSLLAFLNSSVNWIIYGLKNKDIRNAFKQILCRKRKQGSGSTQMNLTIESFNVCSQNL
jgi:hypothetical protein